MDTCHSLDMFVVSSCCRGAIVCSHFGCDTWIESWWSWCGCDWDGRLKQEKLLKGAPAADRVRLQRSYVSLTIANFFGREENSDTYGAVVEPAVSESVVESFDQMLKGKNSGNVLATCHTLGVLSLSDTNIETLMGAGLLDTLSLALEQDEPIVDTRPRLFRCEWTLTASICP